MPVPAATPSLWGSSNSRGPPGRTGGPLPRATVLLLAGCVLASGASVVLVSALNYDAWGWLIWGREIVGHLPFTTLGYPSWKPLTGLIAIPLAPLGDAAPTLWLVVERSAAALALVLAYRLGRRAAGRLAGCVAALSVLVVPGWLFQTGVGGSEPLLTALLLGAVDRHVAGKDGSGLTLAFLAALLRPESWPALLVSCVMTWRQSRLRPSVAAAVVAVPALWFGGDYLGSGDPFTGGHMARLSKEAVLLRRGDVPAPLAVLERAWPMVPLPLLLALPAGLFEGWRRRDPILLSLGVGALGWTGEVAVLSALGYAGIARFLLPAAAAAAIVGAAGLVVLLRLPRAALTRHVLAGLALVALALPLADGIPDLADQGARVEKRADLDQSLTGIVTRIGRAPFRAASHVSAQGIEATALAWHLGVTSARVRHVRVPGLALSLPDDPWPRFKRALRRSHGRYKTRTLARQPGLSLLAVIPRKHAWKTASSPKSPAQSWAGR